MTGKKIQKDEETKKDKKKLIQKQAKQKKSNGKGKKKSERQLKTDKLGRPKYKDQSDFSVEEDPTSNIKQQAVKYLDSIGLCHGLVFLERDRKLLRQQDQKRPEQKRINWLSSHEFWQPQNQKQKAQQTVLKIIPQLSKVSKCSEQAITDLFVRIGEIFCSESTKQIYYLLSQVIKYEAQEEKTQDFIINVYKECRFFNRQFTRLKIPYYILPIKDRDGMRVKFISFFKKLTKELFKLIS